MEGIVLYNIELNNCLNGVHTNDDAIGEIFNEIARPKSNNNIGAESNNNIGADGVSGNYHCAYFEKNNNKVVECELTIEATPHPDMPNTYKYTFYWSPINGKPYHVGIGYKMNEKQIAVRYTDKR